MSSRTNARRMKIEQYLATHGIEKRRVMVLDSMFATLNLVSESNWSTILPGILCLPDIEDGSRHVVPIVNPTLNVDYIRIEPASENLSDASQAFYDVLSKNLDVALDTLNAV